MKKQELLKAVQENINIKVELGYFINTTQDRYMKETDPDKKEELFNSLMDYGHTFIGVRANV